VSFQCRRVSKAYPVRNGAVQALDGITFGVKEHEFVCMVGPSGCGKTTLLKIIAGLMQPTSGELTFDPELADGDSPGAMVFQEHGVFPWMTVLDNVAFGLEMHGVSRRVRRERAFTFVRKVGLEPFANAYPHELSVGMRQRVGIARAFVADPPLLLMDEPFASLDAQIRRVLAEELLSIWKEDQKSVVYVTHDIEEAVLLGDRVLVMTGRPGRVLRDITVPLPRPRSLANGETAAIAEIKREIWKLLEDEVRRSLCL
jgi:NitT/TauT family transport system ATP-binding protein